MRSRPLLALVALAVYLFICAITGALAQTTPDPLQFPLLDIAPVKYLGSFRFPWDDGAGGQISYGSRAAALSADGKALHLSCVYDTTGFATLEIPAIGGLARVLTPCRAHLNRTDIAKVHPDPSAYAPTAGGLLDLGAGNFIASGYISYDAGGTTQRSHFRISNNGATVAGPFSPSITPGLGTDKAGPGMVKSQMGWIPQVWRALLGAPAFIAAGYDSIISRASYGLAITTFDPAAVTADNIAMRMLVGCPHWAPGCNTYQNDAVGKDAFYQGAEHFAVAFIAPGTRTLVSIEREADGPACYGYATTNQALHGTPYPGPGYDAQHVVWCYSLERTDDAYGKGPKGYPYKLVAKLYDMRDVVASKQGTKLPWEIRPYAVHKLPGFGPSTTVYSGVWDPATGRVYVIQNNSDLAANPDRTVVDVLGGFPIEGTSPPPPPAPTGTITATPSTVLAGQTVTVAGTLQNTTTATVTPRIGGVTGPTWSATDTPTSSTTYTVTATTAGGTFTATAAVTVNPPAEVCGDGIDNDGDGLIDENCAVDCVETSGGWGPGPDPAGWSNWAHAPGAPTETRFRQRTWTQTVARVAPGAACTWTTGAVGSTAVERQDDSRPYVPPPPPPQVVGRVRSQATYSSGGAVAGVRLTLQVTAADLAKLPARDGAVTLLQPQADGSTSRTAGTVYRVTPNYGYAGAPTDAQVVLQFPGLQTLAVTIEIVVP